MSQLAIPGALTPTSLRLPEGLELAEWMRVGETLKLMEKSVQWWVGDWLAYGEDHYGEEAFQALERADKTLANWASVCRKVPPSRRREDLRFSHHAEVTKLGPEKQALVLERAAQEHMNVREVRQAADEAERESLEAEFGQVIELKTITCPTCDGEGVVPLQAGES